MNIMSREYFESRVEDLKDELYEALESRRTDCDEMGEALDDCVSEIYSMSISCVDGSLDVKSYVAMCASKVESAVGSTTSGGCFDSNRFEQFKRDTVNKISGDKKRVMNIGTLHGPAWWLAKYIIKVLVDYLDFDKLSDR